MKLVTAEEMREIDRYAIEKLGIPGIILMENAGLKTVIGMREVIPNLLEKRILIVAGKGNNAGDGFVVARHIFNLGGEVKVALCSPSSEIKGDALINFEIAKNIGVCLLEIGSIDELRMLLDWSDIVVDALLGTGVRGEVKGFFAEVIKEVNLAGKPIVAIDLPSGLEASSGRVYGPCIRANWTFTMCLPKLGLWVYPGAYYSGQIFVVDISVPSWVWEKEFNIKRELLTIPYVRELLPLKRDPQSHKGDFGRVLVIAGSRGFTGAAALTSLGALRIGAGLVYLATPESLNDILETKLTEVIKIPVSDSDGAFDIRSFLDLKEHIEKCDVIVLGPGIGTSPPTKLFVHKLIEEINKPIVIDADGLNCLADNVELLKACKGKVVITPHPGEMARLIGKSTSYVQENRLEVAESFSSETGVVVVLKGARTVISSPDGKIYVNPTGNPGMATGGTGDVLTGMIGGLIAQGLGLTEASCVGVFLHGLSGDIVASKKGELSLIASDLLDFLPEAIKEVCSA
ncbi:MAG: NAD(P)H-hydrate dehydratase [Synergistetes bacterium]|nr:NAD(P)H-hydrate dehydratase [Synergistota bacterium]MCX8128176.1 NAD(P)H-hydrate dehydratase [Synergistota bacterium]MDW8192552.1 NAD(P)H-hydrate dehydratase [Synergistota bacterium]